MLLLALVACDGPKVSEPSEPTPSAGALALVPAEPRTDDTLVVTVVGAEGELSYAWEVDGTSVGGDTPTLAGSLFVKGQTVRVVVTAESGGRSVTDSASVSVANTPPGAPVLALAQGSEGLSCAVASPSVDADGDPVTYTFAWSTDAASYAGQTLPAEQTVRGADWTCTATPADDEAPGEPGRAVFSLSGPVPGGYAFELVARVASPADLEPLPDGTLLVATLLGQLVQVDPSTGATLGEVWLYEPDDLVSLALDPRFGDGAHDYVYTWTNHTCVLARHAVTLDPLTVTATDILDTMDCPIAGGHAGGDLLWWAGETDEPVLYLGIGPTLGGNPQEEVEPGQKLLAYAVADDGTVSPGVPAPFENPYIVALGLRNPWRLADCGAAICMADAGSDYYEEIDLYRGAGMNFGYPREEGPGEGRFDDPTLWWEDDDPSYAEADADGSGRAGFVNAPLVGVQASARGYAGRLEGTLLYADLFDGWVRGALLDADGAVLDDVPVASLPYVLAMTEDADGTVWAVSLSGGVFRLGYRVDRAQVAEAGASLAESVPGGVAYDVRYPLWSNGADKDRWIELPVGTTVDTTDPDAWVYPEGTRLWKRFSIDGEPVETRVFEKRDGAWIPGVYIWDGDDAFLTDGTRTDFTLPNGDPYSVPSQYACMTCHDPTRDREAPLGFEPFQLGEDGLDAAVALFDTPPEPPGVVVASDPEWRDIRGWLHGNCAFCHNPTGVVARTSVVLLDFRYDAEETGLIGAHAEYWNANPYENDGLELIVPGDPDASGLVQILEAGDMPPLGVWRPDTVTIDRIRSWISGLE